MFDTLNASRRLESRGFTREQSEDIVEIMRDAQADLFTKKDGNTLREDIRNDMEKMREDNKHDMGKIRDNAKYDMETFRMEIQYDMKTFKEEFISEIATFGENIKSGMEKMELRLTIKMFLIFVGSFSVVGTLNKFFNIF